MVVTSIAFHTVAENDRLPIVVSIVLRRAADPSDFTEGYIVSHRYAKNTVCARISQTKIVEYRIICRQYNILSYRKFNTVKHFAGITGIAAQIKRADNIFRIFSMIARIHYSISERRSIVEDTVRLGKKHQVFGQFFFNVKGLLLVDCG